MVLSTDVVNSATLLPPWALLKHASEAIERLVIPSYALADSEDFSDVNVLLDVHSRCRAPRQGSPVPINYYYVMPHNSLTRIPLEIRESAPSCELQYGMLESQ